MKRCSSSASLETPTDYPDESCAPINTDVEYIMGIDEAGRGPVLGPMVYGLCYFPLKEKDNLARMGFADSKTLSEEKREMLFAKILKLGIGFKTAILDPEMLSNSMLRRSKYNLNDISHDTAIQLVKDVQKKGVKVKEIYVDTVGVPSKYQKKLERIFPGISITVSKKADSLFPVVSAASICAKVIRDHRLKNWQFKEKNVGASREFGSGYPADPKTKAWLANNLDPIFGYPTIIRFSWKTTENLLKDAVPITWTRDEDAKNPEAPAVSKKPKLSHEVSRFHFFTHRGMERCQDFGEPSAKPKQERQDE